MSLFPACVTWLVRFCDASARAAMDRCILLESDQITASSDIPIPVLWSPGCLCFSDWLCRWVVKRLPIDAVSAWPTSMSQTNALLLSRQAAKKEIDVMCRLKHRYIVKYKESFIYEDFTCIVM